MKTEENAQLSSLFSTCSQLVKLRVSLLGKIHGMFVRYSPYLHAFYEQIKARRGTGKAIIATARKLLNTIFHTLKNNWVFKYFTTFIKI